MKKINNIQTSVVKIFEKSNIKFIFRKNNEIIYDKVFSGLSYKPVFFSGSMIKYQEMYFNNYFPLFFDSSIIILSDNRPVGLWIVNFVEIDGVLKIFTFGRGVCQPIFLDEVPVGTIKKICSKIIEAIKCISVEFNFEYVDFDYLTLPPDQATGYSEWHRQLISNGAYLRDIRYDIFTEVSINLDKIRSHFRKSYRSLINVAMKEWSVETLDHINININIWIEFMQLHLNVSGKITRSKETWDAQWEMIIKNEAFLVTLRDKNDDRLVGAGFFQNTCDEGFYSVAAYDRSLFDKPLGHAVQYEAIKRMKTIGIKWYFLGERHYPQGSHLPTKKEISISEFKEGFSTNMYGRPQIRLNNGELQ